MTAFSVDPGEVLLTLAEIAVAFAGFSSIVAIFQQSSDPERGSFDLFRFWVMLEFSLAALFFSLLPLPLGFLGLASGVVWSIAGGALIAFVVGHAVLASRLIRRRVPAVVSSLTRGLSLAANVAFSIIILSQVLNLVGVLGRTFAPYLLGLLLLLFGAALNFVRLVWVGNPSLTR
jgi:hypothetical protein